MRFLTPTRVMLAIVAMLGIFVMLGFFSVMKTLDAIEQPKLTFQREGWLSEKMISEKVGDQFEKFVATSSCRNASSLAALCRRKSRRQLRFTLRRSRGWASSQKSMWAFLDF